MGSWSCSRPIEHRQPVRLSVVSGSFRKGEFQHLAIGGITQPMSRHPVDFAFLRQVGEGLTGFLTYTDPQQNIVESPMFYHQALFGLKAVKSLQFRKANPIAALHVFQDFIFERHTDVLSQKVSTMRRTDSRSIGSRFCMARTTPEMSGSASMFAISWR